MNIQKILQVQEAFFRTGKTLQPAFCEQALRRLYRSVLTHESEIYQALFQDLSKSEQEAYLTEIGIVLSEISAAVKHLKKWRKPKRVLGSLAVIGSTSEIHFDPYGQVLILSPFNYPFQLALVPLVSALAAGNCVVLKPSEFAPHTEKIIQKILSESLPKPLCTVVSGGAETAEKLIHADFDFIFFTGSYSVGKKVYQAAAERLIPVVLELGGKSPCIVDRSADLDLAARRIVWGKYLNAGQTCVAPDYLLVESSVKEKLLQKMKQYIVRFYSEAPEYHPQYPKIISPQHFERLSAMLSQGRIVIGGTTNATECKIAPTIIEDLSLEDSLLQEEIFGPILPVISFQTIEQVYQQIFSHEKPLALYLFTQNEMLKSELLKRVSFGGGCINDTVMHLILHNLPFGGVGASGMGSYHGKAGFDAFTHSKSVLKSTRYFDLPLRYPPYAKANPWIKRILK